MGYEGLNFYMIDHDHDWLDGRLAREQYISDDGFTAGVIDRLPKSRPSSVGTLRWTVLLISTCLAACLALALGLRDFGRFMDAGNRVLNDFPPAEALRHVALIFDRPALLYDAAGGMMLLALASIPFLRRWL